MPAIDERGYWVPLLTQIRHYDRNGLRVVSTFGGAGGSTTGYAMAGYEPVCCVEFTPAAIATYSANWPSTPVIGRDIRDVTGADIRAAAGLGEDDEVDLLDGSPPCDPFSIAGTRDAHWGDRKQYLGHTTQRTDDLFPEFARILHELHPRAFVAENVAGLVAGRARGYFLRTLDALTAVGYAVQAKVLDASRLGVPQARKRLFLVGIRDDLGADPPWPVPLPRRLTLADAFARPLPVTDDPEPTPLSPSYVRDWRRQHRSDADRRVLNLHRGDMNRPCNTLVGLGGVRAGPVHPYEPRRYTVPELRRIGGFPDDYVLTGSYADRMQRIGQSVCPPVAAAIATALTPILTR